MSTNEFQELQIQLDINKHIDDFKCFRFNAGAGAGKTYALIETIKYVTANKISISQKFQNVACITYTNVAVCEIQKRLGNSEAVHVSTIHERIWELIKRAQPELLLCHREKIAEVIQKNNDDLLLSDKSKFFIELQESQKQEFIDFINQTKELFYQSKTLKAADFKQAYTNYELIEKPDFFGKCLRNVENFQFVAGLLYKNTRLKECLDRIDAGKENRVSYDSKVNSDRLHYMKFSHDTLLEYGLRLVKEYPTLCRIIIDHYPYFFIDEYQDTHKNVIQFMKCIHDYSIANKKSWVIGYFGDTAQSIYEDGVGRDITVLHPGLHDINKVFNRRSHQQIIDVINKIRNDEIVQKPIYEDRNGGSILFAHNNAASELDVGLQFLAEYRRELFGEKLGLTDEDSKIHCLVLTNKLMAVFNGFGDVYDVFAKSTIYYDDLKTQVLSQQLEKLHPTILIIYYLIKLHLDIQQGIVSYYDIFGSASKYISFSKASLVIREINSGKLENLKDLIDLITCRLENSDAKDELGSVLINRIHLEKNNVVSGDSFKNTIATSFDILMNIDSQDVDKVDSLLSLPISSLIKWVNFIDGVETGDIIYHTYHGTKGEEYNNVAIIMQHSFGNTHIGRNKFRRYFEHLQLSNNEQTQRLTNETYNKEFCNTQNLMYVACSRAIKNLRVLYLDDISGIHKGIELIFGEVSPWEVNQSN